MIEDVIINDSNISELLERDELSEAARYLFQQQLFSRPELEQRYYELSQVLVKIFLIDKFTVELHFNPARLTSTSAPTDESSIQNRECFLCHKNLPPEQKGILYDNYLLLVNPFPIFTEHFTIAHKDHSPQSIADSFDDFLLLSKKLSPYLTIFYNGPQCGASAPDHLHFQAGTKGMLPVENELSYLEHKYGETLKAGPADMAAIDDGLRKIILIRSDDAESIKDLFYRFFNIYKKYSQEASEPMLNIIAMFDKGVWDIITFLREKHRPDAFYSKGEDNFLVSPAAADLGGICISPLRKDYEKAELPLIKEIVREVSLDDKKFDKLKGELRNL